jgi:hypothetical protein
MVSVKLKIIQEAEKIGNHAVGRKYENKNIISACFNSLLKSNP